MTDTKSKSGEADDSAAGKIPTGKKSPKQQQSSESEDGRAAAGDENRSKEFRQLLECGLDTKVASKLEEIFKTGKDEINSYRR